MKSIFALKFHFSHDVIKAILFSIISDQRNLGMSMRVERSTLDQVKQRMEMNKRKREEKQKEYDFEQRLKELKDEVSLRLDDFFFSITIVFNQLFI